MVRPACSSLRSPLRVFFALACLGAAAGCAANAASSAPEPTCGGGSCEAEPEAASPDEAEGDDEPATGDAGTKKDAGKADAGKKDGGKADGGSTTPTTQPTNPGNPPDASAPDAAPPSVGGATVNDCQGDTVLVADFGGQKPTVQSGFAIYSGGQHEVYAYSRAAVTDYAYGGTAGETKVRLLLPRITGPGQYQGMMGVFSWDVAQGKWVNYATPTQTVVVTIASYNVVMPTGLMCNGHLLGRAEALFSPNNVVVLDFSVPLLTPSFPKSKPGPP